MTDIQRPPGEASCPPERKFFSPSLRNAAPGAIRSVLVCVALIAAIEIGLAELDPPARRALAIFALAVVGWTMTPLDDTFVALAAAVAMALLVVGSPDQLFAALGDNLVWLLVAAFIFGAAFRLTGLADLLVRRVVARAHSLRMLFHSLTGVMLASAFMIPSTAGRAAIMLPIFATIAGTMSNARVRVAFALLFPTVILLSAFASLVGAGAHIAAVELLTRMTGQRITFAYWMLLGLPLAAASSFLAAEVILRMFLTAEERHVSVAAIEDRGREISVLKQPVVWVAGLVLAGWLTAPLHGINETLIAVLGAVIITAPGVGAISFKDALKDVDWNLLVFLAASIALAQGLVSADVADQLLDGPFGDLGHAGLPPLAFAAIIAVVGLLLHLVIHSRTARVAVLLPPVLLVADEADLGSVSMTLVAVAATGFCQTLMVSAKPVIMFGKIEGVTYTQGDLVWLAAVLAPLHLALVLLFAGVVWPWLGVALAQ